jgi:hypothetical protein
LACVLPLAYAVVVDVVQVYLQLYADAFRKALLAIRKNAWTVLLPALLLIARDWVGRAAQPLGMIGGILGMLAAAALSSCYLYFLGELARGSRVSLKEVGSSLGAYLWSIVNVYFVVWLAALVLELLLSRSSNAAAVMLALWIVATVALNAVPEVIYLRGTYGGLHTISASWEFLQRQWIPWFAVNVPLLALVAAVMFLVRVPFVTDFLVAAALHVVMVFRGYLFQALDGSSHRRRMFERRVA